MQGSATAEAYPNNTVNLFTIRKCVAVCMSWPVWNYPRATFIFNATNKALAVASHWFFALVVFQSGRAFSNAYNGDTQAVETAALIFALVGTVLLVPLGWFTFRTRNQASAFDKLNGKLYDKPEHIMWWRSQKLTDKTDDTSGHGGLLRVFANKQPIMQAKNTAYDEPS